MAQAKHSKRLGYYGLGRTTPIYDELRESVAYKVLTPIERLVLLDYLRVYSRASGWDTVPVKAEGFRYTYDQCGEIISDRAFYKALHRLQEIGFFVWPEELQERRPAAPRRFVPSSTWKDYVPTKKEAKKLQKLESSKKRRLQEKRKRRTDFRSGLSCGENKTSPTKVRRQDRNRVRRHIGDNSEQTGTEFADTTPQIDDSDRNRVRRSIIAIPTLSPSNTNLETVLQYRQVIEEMTTKMRESDPRRSDGKVHRDHEIAVTL